MRLTKSEVPTFSTNVGTFPKLTIAQAAGRRPMADCLSATIIVPARAFVNYSASKTVCQAFIVPARAFVNPLCTILHSFARLGRRL